MDQVTANVSESSGLISTVQPDYSETNEAVVIVHGTFASHADWIQPSSQFLLQLGKQLEGRTIHIFPWTGENSHKARAEAGEQLAGFVDGLCSTGRAQRFWCVTHSHGGNVALYALRNHQFAQRVAGIAFFGTPFLHLHRRNLQRFCKIAEIVLKCASVIIGAILLIALSLLIFARLFFDGTADIIKEVFVEAIFFGSTIGASYCGFPLAEWANRKLKSVLSEKQDRIWALVAQPRPACPTFIATVRRDEAARVLTTIDDVAVIPWITWDVAVRATLAVTLTYYILAFYGGVIFNVPAFGGLSLDNRIVLGVLLVVIVGPFFATLFVAALRGTCLAFGSEGIVAASTVRIRPSQSPPWSVNSSYKLEYVPDRGTKGYRHSFFYRDEHVIKDVATWIRSHGQNAESSRVIKQDPKPLSTARAFLARWSIPVAASTVMLACFSLSAIDEIRNLDRLKFDLNLDASPIRGDIQPAFRIDRPLKGAYYYPGGMYVSRIDPIFAEETIDAGLSISQGADCVVSGEAKLSDWDMALELYLYRPRPLSEAQEGQALNRKHTVEIEGQQFSDEDRRPIWNWEGSSGKNVQFSRRFRSDFSLPGARLALHMRNQSPSRERVILIMYTQCN